MFVLIYTPSRFRLCFRSINVTKRTRRLRGYLGAFHLDRRNTRSTTRQCTTSCRINISFEFCARAAVRMKLPRSVRFHSNAIGLMAHSPADFNELFTNVDVTRMDRSFIIRSLELVLTDSTDSLQNRFCFCVRNNARVSKRCRI